MTKTFALLAVFLLAFAPRISRARANPPPKPETPKRGGTLRLANRSDWRSLDPAIAFDSDAAPIQKLLFRGLIDFDDGINLVPDQARDWRISPDGKTYTFHLRPGVRFSNGREVEAEDYVFSFERILDPKTKSQGQTYFLDILGAREFNEGKALHVRGLSAPDRQTLVIQLEQSKFTFRYILAMDFADVVPREVVKKYGMDFQYHLTGSGPYHVAEWRRNVRYRFDRNPYYNGPPSYVDGFDIMIGGDETLFAMMIERNELDRAFAGPADAIRFRRDPRLRSRLHPVHTANTDFLIMNTEMKPFDDVRVRRAFNYAINKERMLKLAAGFGSTADGIIPPSMPWSNPGLPRYEFSPAKARALLGEAGLPNGFKTELWFPITPPALGHMAAGVQQDLHDVGIQVDLRPTTVSALEVKIGQHRQVPFGLWGWLEDYPDPSDYLDVLLNGERITDGDCNNWAFYNNPKVNQLLDQAGTIIDVGQRTLLFQEAEKEIMADAPWIPLIHEQYPIIYSSRVRGIREHPVWLWRFEHMWINQ